MNNNRMIDFVNTNTGISISAENYILITQDRGSSWIINKSSFIIMQVKNHDSSTESNS